MNIPLLITFIRLIISPLVPAALLVFLLPSAPLFIHIFLAFLFVLMAFTDFLDGYLARRLKQETILGKLLDPIADKMLVLCTSIALVYVGKMYWLWAIIMLGREIIVMGLREVSLVYGFSVPVAYIGKLKTAAQYIYLFWVICNPGVFKELEVLLLIIMLFLTLYSGIYYAYAFKKNRG